MTTSEGIENETDFQKVVKERQSQVAWISRIEQLALQNLCGVLSVPQTPHLSLRSLYKSEVDTLSTFCRCQCRDWSKIRLLLPTEQHRLDQSNRLRSLVSDNCFDGTVVLCCCRQDKKSDETSEWNKLPPGIHSNLLISDCILHLDAWVYHNSLVSNTYVGPQAVLLKCGVVSCDKSTNYSSLSLCVGAESGGGRKLNVQAESTIIDVCRQLSHPNDKSSATGTLPNDISSNFNILSTRSVVRDTPTIQGIYLHPGASIVAATSVSSAVLLPAASIRNACTVSNVLLQWDCCIVDHSVVSDAMLMEQAVAGPQSTVASSILATDVHVSAGEVHASVVGPNSNAHHQSLVIGVLWPLGRGNVGYGANVGSNHTGRLPDQETASGEGTFWGLSSVIKFPVDLSSAPYSVVAAGTTLPPQRICMPFSLIVEGDGGRNQIIPGWVLKSSPYTLARSEKKFATRRKAKRHDDHTGWKIIRPETIDLCVAARQALMDVASPQETYRSDKMLPGIGSNTLSEKGRQAGIQAYTACIQRFALQGLLSFLMHAKKAGKSMDETMLMQAFSDSGTDRASHARRDVQWNSFPWEVDESKCWDYQRSLLLEEFPLNSDIVSWLSEALNQLVSLEKQYAESVYRCKRRDDTRGKQTIPGYEHSHVSAEDDPVIKDIRAAAQQTEESVHRILLDYDQTQRSKL